ncbi:MAG TPA: cyclic nucleotide-binding domain-containing protein, partial [Pyrinomonadaceae bacterium]|nr:cyclic nucleotide-binding domain-containing protein [Pyrinomonadaceae bacterium]
MEEIVSGGIEANLPTNSSPPDKVEALRRVHVFADLSDEQLQWFADNSEDRRFAAGDVMFRKGDKPEAMVVYLEGEVHAYWDESDHDIVYIAQAGDQKTEVSGMLPFSRMTEFQVTGYAVTDVRLLWFPVTHFPEMMLRMPVLVQRLVGIMSDRVRESTTLDQQQDKLMALGKLSAGLAHELNNPAAGATRAADDLIETLKELRAADMRLCSH